MVRSSCFVILLFCAAVSAQTQFYPASGCLTISYDPPSGTIIPGSTLQLTLNFNKQVDITQSTGARSRPLLNFAPGSGLESTLLSTTAASGATHAETIVLRDITNPGSDYQPTAATTTAAGTSLTVTFTSLPAATVFRAVISHRFLNISDLNSFHGWANYSTAGAAPVAAVAEPSEPICYRRFSTSAGSDWWSAAASGIADTSANTYSVTPVSCASPPCSSWSATVQLTSVSHTGSMNITSLQDTFGDTYSIIQPVSVSWTKGETIHEVPASIIQAMSPVYELSLGEQIFPSTYLPTSFAKVSNLQVNFNSDMAIEWVQRYFDMKINNDPLLTLLRVGPGTSVTNYPGTGGVYALLNATQIQEQFTLSSYQAEFTFVNGSVIQIFMAKNLGGRPYYSWIMKANPLPFGYQCSAGSPRNAMCPSCSSMSHYLLEDTTTTYSLLNFAPASLTTDYQASVTVNDHSVTLSTSATGQNSSMQVSLTADVSLDTAVFGNYKLLMLDDRLYGSQNSETWMLVPSSVYGQGCGQLGVSPDSFFEQPNACQKAPGSCTTNQISDWLVAGSDIRLLSQYTSRLRGTVANAYSYGSTKPRVRFTPTGSRVQLQYKNTDTIAMAVTVTESQFAFYEPAAQVQNMTYATDRIAVVVTNTGQATGEFNVSVSCNSTSLAFNSAWQTAVLASGDVTSMTFLATVGSDAELIGCSATASIRRQALWSAIGKVHTLADGVVFKVRNNAICDRAQSEAFLVLTQSAFQANASALQSVTNAFQLQVPVGSWIVQFPQPVYQQAATSSIVNTGTSAATLTVTLTCSSELQVQQATQSQLCGAGAQCNFTHVMTTIGAEVPTVPTCQMTATLTTQQCWSSLGKAHTETGISVTLPTYVCALNMAFEEAFLVLSRTAYAANADALVSVDNPFVFLSNSSWTATNGRYRKTATAIISNAGDASGNFTASLSCAGTSVTVLSVTPQWQLCAAGARCAVQFLLDSAGSGNPFANVSCTVRITVGTQLCWSALGKVGNSSHIVAVAYNEALNLQAAPGFWDTSFGEFLETRMGRTGGSVFFGFMFIMFGVLLAAVILSIKRVRRYLREAATMLERAFDDVGTAESDPAAATAESVAVAEHTTTSAAPSPKSVKSARLRRAARNSERSPKLSIKLSRVCIQCNQTFADEIAWNYAHSGKITRHEYTDAKSKSTEVQSDKTCGVKSPVVVQMRRGPSLNKRKSERVIEEEAPAAVAAAEEVTAGAAEQDVATDAEQAVAADAEEAVTAVDETSATADDLSAEQAFDDFAQAQQETKRRSVDVDEVRLRLPATKSATRWSTLSLEPQDDVAEVKPQLPATKSLTRWSTLSLEPQDEMPIELSSTVEKEDVEFNRTKSATRWSTLSLEPQDADSIEQSSETADVDEVKIELPATRSVTRWSTLS